MPKTRKKNGEGVWDRAVLRISGNNQVRCRERVVPPVPSPAGKRIRGSAEVGARIALRNVRTIACSGPFVPRSQDWAPTGQLNEVPRGKRHEAKLTPVRREFALFSGRARRWEDSRSDGGKPGKNKTGR